MNHIPLDHTPKMLATTICYKCGKSYTITSDEQFMLPNMRLEHMANSRIKPKVVLTTWADWIEHISTHCHDCRYSQPPRSCREDWAKFNARNQ